MSELKKEVITISFVLLVLVLTLFLVIKDEENRKVEQYKMEIQDLQFRLLQVEEELNAYKLELDLLNKTLDNRSEVVEILNNRIVYLKSNK